MKALRLVCLIGGLLMASQAHAATRVWGFYGWGDNAGGSSRGIDQIAAKARHIPGVVSVRVFNYWQTQAAADEIMRAPSGDNIVLYGYSCGANAVTSFFNLPRKLVVLGIQESLWCGGYPIAGNVTYAQETYAGCLLTLGFGCKRYVAGPGFTGRIVLIRRPDIHPAADTDPDAQRDVLTAITFTANPIDLTAKLKREPRVREIVRYHGERAD